MNNELNDILQKTMALVISFIIKHSFNIISERAL